LLYDPLGEHSFRVDKDMLVISLGRMRLYLIDKIAGCTCAELITCQDIVHRVYLVRSRGHAKLITV